MPSHNPIHIISDKIHLNQYPEKVSDHPNGYKISIGDLHSNPVKLMYFLIREGIISLDKESYYSFYQDYCALENVYYHKEPLGSELRTDSVLKIDYLISLIQAISLNTDKKIKITLVGDVLADRGYCDALIIELLLKMHSLRIDFEIISSNHDLYFLEYWQSGYIHLPENIFNANQGQSLERFHLVKEELGYDTVKLDEFTNHVYLPRLKLLSYDLTDEGIVVYSHAPMLFHSIASLAFELNVGVFYKDDTPHQLACSIDLINLSYIRKLMHPSLSEKIDVSKIEMAHGTFYPAIRSVHWARVKDLLLSPGLPREPDFSLDYQIRFVYGHDGQSILYANGLCYPLDNMLGKLKEEYNQGTYLISSVNMLNENAYAYELFKEKFKEESSLPLSMNKLNVTPASTAPTQDNKLIISPKRQRSTNRPRGADLSANSSGSFDPFGFNQFTDNEIDLVDSEPKKPRLTLKVPDFSALLGDFVSKEPPPVLFRDPNHSFQGLLSRIELHILRHSMCQIKTSLNLINNFCEEFFKENNELVSQAFKMDVNLFLKMMQQLGYNRVLEGKVHYYDKPGIENILYLQLSSIHNCTVKERVESIIETHQLKKNEEDLLYLLFLAALESFRVGYVLQEIPDHEVQKNFFKI